MSPATSSKGFLLKLVLWQHENMLLRKSLLITTALTLLATSIVSAQAPPPLLPPPQLDQLVQRIALYPDPLLAQILAAATYSDQIADADMWANQHNYLHGDELAKAIQGDQLPWDPSVQALLPFPGVLHTMNSDPAWTQQLGNAFLAQSAQVMDAVQRDRQMAYDYGYLRTNSYYSVVVGGPHAIIINPINPGLFYVPIYDPLIVYARPRPGFVVGGAIGFGGVGISIGAAFAPWGWGAARFGWTDHTVFIHDRPGGRTWANRGTYAHPYAARRFEPSKRVETHRLEPHHDERRGGRGR
jgi:hypothetical protein